MFGQEPKNSIYTHSYSVNLMDVNWDPLHKFFLYDFPCNIHTVPSETIPTQTIFGIGVTRAASEITICRKDNGNSSGIEGHV